MEIGSYIFMFAVSVWLAFLWFVPSDNPKSWRSQVQNGLKKDWGWNFIVHLAIWAGITATIVFALIDIHMGW
ncbi:MAG: hypothetical protein HFG08_09790 [Oscillibacter sp.]|jgi:hypothetical protein|nr:hypothetical protein [Oscillibacter sp.]